jgi:RHS repeat-associated protein
MPDASFSAAPITFTYSSTGKRASMTDPTGTTNYTYSNRDQVLTKATPEGTLTYTYDLSGNVASVLSSNVNGTNVAYAWDADNRLSNLTDNGTSAMTNYTYDETSQLASMQYPNGVAHAFTYDNRDRPTTLGVTGPLGLSLSYAQTFSPSGRKSNVTEQSGRDTNYGYSSVYRLLNETVTGDPTTPNNGALTYVLDPVGNRSSLTSTLEALPNQSFTYDADDRLSSDTYDADGNTLTSSGHIFSYDFEDRLTQFDTSVQMSYDGDGNRITRTQGGSTIRYLVDDITPTGYPQVAEEVVNGSVAAQFTYGSWRISQKRSGVVSYYGYDDGGSVRELFSDTGAVTDTDTYDAFGNTVAQTGSTVNEFLYRGEQLDSVLGMYYLRARYYVPKSGRFLTADKFELSNRSDRARIRERLLEASHHRYLYSLGDGVNLIDPTGLSVIEGEIGVVDELLAASDVGDGLEIHHIIQARFAQILGVEEGEMMGIALSPDAHAFFDALWSIEIAQDGLSAETLLEDIVEVAEEIYAGEGPLEAWVAQWKASLQAIGAIP